ncbi:MAG: pilus assembly protein [Rhizobiales bacterium]|nr:pilus assembly protein [Hyphomicrobiales bacterium]
MGIFKREASGQSTVEFALCSLVFLMIVFGTIDFGRAIFTQAQLANAVREGARYAKVHPTALSTASSTVTTKGPGGTTVTVMSCSPSPCATGSTVTVTATVGFSAFTQKLLGIGPITLSSTSKVGVE